ncbi:MAG: TetR/AcrR family transcriptional regulator, partial [Actinomycetota bacterium]|nr:TetR/AcrR family transcriptional regulator [Actinomycetota bacterium]
MEDKAITMTARRTQADRSSATRHALVVAARELFSTAGFDEVGTERIAAAAGVTRGALYHQFADKTELFAAVFEIVEIEITAHLVDVLARAPAGDAAAVLVAGADAWLDACADPAVQRIVLIDGPAVLGWARWREIGLRHGLGLVTSVLEAAMAAGSIAVAPVDPLAHALVGALDEAVLYVAGAADPVRARAEMG